MPAELPCPCWRPVFLFRAKAIEINAEDMQHLSTLSVGPAWLLTVWHAVLASQIEPTTDTSDQWGTLFLPVGLCALSTTSLSLFRLGYDEHDPFYHGSCTFACWRMLHIRKSMCSLHVKQFLVHEITRTRKSQPLCERADCCHKKYRW